MEATVFRAARIPTRSSVTSSGLLRWTYWKDYTASEPAYRQFLDGSEIDRLKVQLVYKQRRQQGLWWWANCVASINPKASIRSTRTRDIRRAFIDALNKSGYDEKGSKEDGKAGLSGSLQLLGTAKVVDPRWDVNLKQDCMEVLRQVMHLHGKPDYDKPDVKRSGLLKTHRRQADYKQSSHSRLDHRRSGQISSLQTSWSRARHIKGGHQGTSSRSIKLP